MYGIQGEPRRAINRMFIGLLSRALQDSHHLPLAWAVLRSNRKRLDDILSVNIINGGVQPTFRNEHMGATEVLCRPIGAVVVDRDNGLEIKTLTIRKFLQQLTS